MKIFIIALLLSAFMVLPVKAQMDTAAINALYKEVKNYYDKNDSIRIYARQILKNAEKLNYDKGIFYAMRLTGIAAQNEEDNTNALKLYLQALGLTERRGLANETAVIFTDIGSCYVTLQQYEQAVSSYTKALTIAEKINEKKLQGICHNSLGACYRHLKKYPEAIVAYQQAEKIKQAIGDRKGLVATRNNIGSLLIFSNRYAEALPYFKDNYAYDLQNGNDNDLYFDYVNLGAAYEGMNQPALALQYYDSALATAKKLESKEKEAACYEQLSGYYKKIKDWPKAYEYVENYQVAYKDFINEKNAAAVAEMQEKYNAAAREKDNKLLQANLTESKLHKTMYGIGALAALVAAVAIGIAFFQNKKSKNKTEAQNKLIQQQNNKLAELNTEKNKLISMVSHDLATPFASIHTWSNVLSKNIDVLDDEQVMAVSKIKASVNSGQQLIKQVLDIDKMEMHQHQLHIERFDVVAVLQNIADNFSKKASEKNIHLSFDCSQQSIQLVSDKTILQRIAENLLSNAIKFTPAANNIYMQLSEEKDGLVMIVKDEGVGMDENDLSKLFQPYVSISSKPTAGENSTGLGLSIVKRMSEEINASINVESKKGEGSTFTLRIKK
jgi:signal transduction histidine kinase